jgi:hypothetical protein
MRRALKRDLAEPAIVSALEKIGALVFRMHTPADLLVRFKRQWFVLEVKTLGTYRDKRQIEQEQFIALTDTPRVRTPEDALRAIGAINRKRKVFVHQFGDGREAPF